MSKRKSWIEKLNVPIDVKIKTIEKGFADMPSGCKMLVVNPKIIDDYINQIPYGKDVSLTKIRNDLSKKYNADKTCPVSTGIFLRIVSEASFENFRNGEKLENITPFWRAVDPKTNLAKKLNCGIKFVQEQRKKEKIPT